MTRYPKRAGDGRYRIEAGRPRDQIDTIVDYHDDPRIAREAAEGVALRPDACRAIVFDMAVGRIVDSVLNPHHCPETKTCRKCSGVDQLHATRSVCPWAYAGEKG